MLAGSLTADISSTYPSGLRLLILPPLTFSGGSIPCSFFQLRDGGEMGRWFLLEYPLACAQSEFRLSIPYYSAYQGHLTPVPQGLL